MSLASYSDLQTELGNFLGHSLFSGDYATFVTLFEATANRRLRTRAMEATTILVPSNPAPITITGAAIESAFGVLGSVLIRLTVPSTATMTTGQEFTVANVGGLPEANGIW